MVSELESQELGNRIKGMTEDEIASLLQNVPTKVLYTEIGRRIEKSQTRITKMKQALED